MAKNNAGQLEKVEKIIKEACSNGKYSITLFQSLSDIVRNVLKEKGFFVSENATLNEVYSTTISWEDTKV